MPKLVKNEQAFSLIELLVVIVIIALLSLLTFVSFTQVQKNARNAQRKSDLQTVAGVLQRFYSDYARYPSSSSGQISYNSGNCGSDSGTSAAAWGSGSIVCGSENYTKALPSEPLPSAVQYCYSRTTTQSYELYANLEASTGNSYTCNGVNYNYRVTAND